MEYDTYKFESKRWKCKGIYFCKIDTWLQGILRPEHPGLFKGCMEPGRVTKKSIFNEESVQDIAGNRDNGHADLAAMGGHMERDIDLGGPRLHDTTSDSSSDGEDGEEAQSADPPGADAQVMWAAEPEAEASRGLGEWQTT